MSYTTSPLGIATEALTPLLTKLEQSGDEYSRWVAAEIFDTLDHCPPQGTLKSWMQEHHGALETVQFNRHDGTAWAPTGRKIDALRATYVELSGSRRDYGGMKVVAVKSNVIVVVDDWHVVAYVVQPVSGN